MVSTGLLSAMMLMSSGMYIFNNAEISQTFTGLGFPTFIVYPLAFLKIAGVIALWGDFNKNLTQWAYAGFFFNFLLAMAAHINIADGEFYGAVMALTLLAISYFGYTMKSKELTTA